MNQNMIEKIRAVLIGLLFFAVVMFAVPAFAGGDRIEQDQHQKQEQGQHQESRSEAHAAAESLSEANNEGNSLSVNSESGPADLVLVPNNNTEKCLRVFGFSFGNRDGSGMFGVPWRSKQCDYKSFAADADAQGNLELGWFWRCHMKSAYKVFKGKDESTETAIGQCQERMMGKVAQARTIEKLRAENEFLQNERRIEREKCSEAKNRITESCYQK